MELIAGKALQRGEEIFISYSAGAHHGWGPDESLAHYGFVERAAVAAAGSDTPPLPLCAANASAELDLLSLKGRTVRGQELHAEISRLQALHTAESKMATEKSKWSLEHVNGATPASRHATKRRHAAVVVDYWAECHDRLTAALRQLKRREHLGATKHGGPQDHHSGAGELLHGEL